MFLSSLALLVAFASCVLASIEAAPYEAIYFYQAYRMEYVAKDGQNLNMAPDLIDKRRVATFDEFVDSVYQGQVGDYQGGFNPTSYAEDATIDQMATDLQNSGFTNAHYEPDYLKKSFRFNAGYSFVMKGIANTIENSRAAGVGGRDLDLARLAVGGILEQRVADNAAGEATDLIHYFLEFHNFEFSTKTETIASGRSYISIDWAASIDSVSDDPKAREAFDEAVEGFIDDYYNPTGSGYSHKSAIVSVKTAQDRIMNVVSTC